VQTHEEPTIQVQVFWDMMLYVWVSTVAYDVPKYRRWRYNDPFKCWELHVTCQKTWIFSDTDV